MLLKETFKLENSWAIRHKDVTRLVIFWRKFPFCFGNTGFYILVPEFSRKPLITLQCLAFLPAQTLFLLIISVFFYYYFICFEAITLSSSRLLSSTCVSGKNHLLTSKSTEILTHFHVILSFCFCCFILHFLSHITFSPPMAPLPFTLLLSLLNSFSLLSKCSTGALYFWHYWVSRFSFPIVL